MGSETFEHVVTPGLRDEAVGLSLAERVEFENLIITISTEFINLPLEADAERQECYPIPNPPIPRLETRTLAPGVSLEEKDDP